MRRLLSLPLLFAAIAVSASGCGGSSSSDPLGGPLSYMPKDTPVVVAIDTNLKSQQAQNVGKLLDKFGPIGNSIKQQLKKGVQSGSNVDFDTDIKPLLGNDLVVGIPDAKSLNGGGNTPTIEAIKTKDAGKAKAAAAKGSTKVGSSHGADIYKDNSGTYTAVQGDTLVGADTQAMLEAALARHDGGSHMSKDDFTSALGDLDKNAIVRVAGNLQTIINQSPGSAKARNIKWVAALRKFGLTASAQPSSVAVDFQVQTAGGLADSDLPIASGSAGAPVVKRPGEIGIGLRNPQQVYNFVLSALQATNPQQFGQFQAAKQQIGSRLGVNIDKDLIGQLTGNATASATTSSQFAARADLKNPATFKTALAKAVKALPAIANQFGGGGIKISAPKNGFYGLTNSKTKKNYVFGVAGNSFVIATDAARAKQFAAQQPVPVAGAQGSVTLDVDTRAIVNQALKSSGLPPLLQAFTGSLGELSGYLKADTSSLRGNFTLKIQ
jgi:hypothetical protein